MPLRTSHCATQGARPLTTTTSTERRHLWRPKNWGESCATRHQALLIARLVPQCRVNPSGKNTRMTPEWSTAAKKVVFCLWKPIRSPFRIVKHRHKCRMILKYRTSFRAYAGTTIKTSWKQARCQLPASLFPIQTFKEHPTVRYFPHSSHWSQMARDSGFPRILLRAQQILPVPGLPSWDPSGSKFTPSLLPHHHRRSFLRLGFGAIPVEKGANLEAHNWFVTMRPSLFFSARDVDCMLVICFK